MTTQIAVKLPDELVGELDRLIRSRIFASRSQAVRASLENLVELQRRQELDQRYRDAMSRFPETDHELADAARLAEESIHDEPWERWW